MKCLLSFTESGIEMPPLSLLPSSPPPITTSSKSSLPVAIRTNLSFSSIAKAQPLHETLRLFRLLPFHDTVTFNTAISASLRHRKPVTSIQLFLSLLDCSLSPDPITFRLVLTAISELNDHSLFLQIHGYLTKIINSSGLFSTSDLLVLFTKMIGIYCMFGLEKEALKLFDIMPQRDEMTYTTMMVGFIEAQLFNHALKVFVEMTTNGNFEINGHAYSSALHACSCSSNLFLGTQIHANAIKFGLESDIFVGTGLVDLYTKNGMINSAKIAFVSISEPNIISWNTLLSGKLIGIETLNLFSLMRESGPVPDRVTFGTVFKSLKDPNSNPFVIKQLHGLALKMVTQPSSDVFLTSALFDAYINKDCFYEAKKVVEKMKKKDHGAYNIIIQGYISNFHQNEAIYMLLEGLKRNKAIRELTLTMILTNLGLNEGTQLHGLFIKFGIDYFITPIIKFYIKEKHINEAIILFNQIENPDIVHYTSLMTALSHANFHDLSLQIYIKMLHDELVGPTNEYTYPIILSSCAELAAIKEGKQIHAQILKSGFEIQYDNFVVGGLIQMYSKCGYIEAAQNLFDGMPKRDLACWNAMINGLSLHGYGLKAIALFNEMSRDKDIEPNEITYVGVLSACSRSGLVENGYKYFEYINNPTINHYACLIDMLGRAGRLDEAIGIITKMPFEPNENMYTSLLAACCKHGNVELGEYCFKELFKLNRKDPGNYIALSNLYASCGRWSEVKKIRKLMRSEADIKTRGISWLSGVSGGNIVLGS